MKKRVFILAGILLCVAGIAVAQTFYVKYPGSNIIQYQDRTKVPGKVFYVDSGATAASDITSRGFSPDQPFATIDYAVSRCTDNAGDVIYVMPGHTEDSDGSTAGEVFDVDIAGVTIIGLGTGTDRPRIDINKTDCEVAVSADNVTIRNLTFRPSVSAVTNAINVEASADNLVFEYCEFMEGEAGSTDEFNTAINLVSANNYTIIRNNTFYSNSSSAPVTAIILTAASTHVQITGNLINGPYSTAAIDDGAACTELLIENNRIKVKDGEPGIELASTTTGIIRDNIIESTTLADPDLAIVAADCSWFNNYVVTTDGAAQELIGTSTESDLEAGSVFMLACVLEQDSVVAGGVAVTTASAGGILYVEDVIIQNGGTAFDTAAEGGSLELYTNNVRGSASFMVTTEASLAAANAVMELHDAATTQTNVVLETGKIISVKASGEDFTSDGLFTIYLILRRGANGATATAGATCL